MAQPGGGENAPISSAVFSPRKLAAASTDKALLSKDHRSQVELRIPLNFLNQNKTSFKRSKSENTISISKKLVFAELDDIPEEDKDHPEVLKAAAADQLAKETEKVVEENVQTPKPPTATADNASTCIDLDDSKIETDKTDDEDKNKLQPFAEAFTDLMCKPLSISPVTPVVISTASSATACVDSPTTTSLAKSVRALSVKTPQVPTTPSDSEGNQPSPASIKRTADPTWTSPTSSRPSKRTKAISCDVLMTDVENRDSGNRSQSLHKWQSDPAAIFKAIQQSESDPLLIGDSSKHYVLPIMTEGKHSDLKEITPETMAAVLKGDYSTQLNSYQIIDCRYPYEFDGGHITGAMNLYTQRQVHDKFLVKRAEAESGAERHILIFHCEFSSQRAPNMSRFIRDIDRTLNKDHYPALHYPELYILHGGYKLFYESNPSLCTPSAYLPMGDEDHSQELNFYKNKAKDETIKAGAGGSRTVSHSNLSSDMKRKTKSFNRLCF